MVYLGGAVLAGIMKVHILYPLPPTHTDTACECDCQTVPYFSKSRLAIGGSSVAEVEAFHMIMEIKAQELT